MSPAKLETRLEGELGSLREKNRGRSRVGGTNRDDGVTLEVDCSGEESLGGEKGRDYVRQGGEGGTMGVHIADGRRCGPIRNGDLFLSEHRQELVEMFDDESSRPMSERCDDPNRGYPKDASRKFGESTEWVLRRVHRLGEGQSGLAHDHPHGSEKSKR